MSCFYLWKIYHLGAHVSFLAAPVAPIIELSRMPKENLVVSHKKKKRLDPVVIIIAILENDASTARPESYRKKVMRINLIFALRAPSVAIITQENT